MWSNSFSGIWSMLTSHPEARRRNPRTGSSSFDHVAASGPLILQRGADENGAAAPVGGGVSRLPKAQQQGRLLARTVALLMARMFCVLVSPVLCSAQVQLPTVNLGDTNFEDAFAGPGWLLQEFPEAYVASELKDSHGKAILGSNPVTGYSTTTHVAFVSKKRVLGGWLLGKVLPPLLYYRLQVFEIAIPPLRDRKSDVLPLADAFLQDIARSFGRSVASLTASAKQALLEYRWPGNVRELRNALERAAILSEGGLTAPQHLLLPTEQRAASAETTDLNEVERHTIGHVMRETRGNKSRAAKRLGLTRTQLYGRLRKYGLDSADL